MHQRATRKSSSLSKEVTKLEKTISTIYTIKNTGSLEPFSTTQRMWTFGIRKLTLIILLAPVQHHTVSSSYIAFGPSKVTLWMLHCPLQYIKTSTILERARFNVKPQQVEVNSRCRTAHCNTSKYLPYKKGSNSINSINSINIMDSCWSTLKK